MAVASPDLNVRHAGAVTVVEFKDRRLTDQIQIQRIGEQLTALVDASNPPLIVIGFGKVEFLSSAALSLLINLERSIRAKSGQLRLAAVSKDLLQIFTMLKLHKLAKMHDTVDQAIQDIAD
jgi:anti-sigma B factor antagonist